jgi:dethiobiotin synthetase
MKNKDYSRHSGSPDKIPAAALFIVGTDTDVGKTVVTACLAAAAIEAGLAVAIMKPVQTGTSNAASDLAVIHHLVPGLSTVTPGLDCVYSFPLAASPHLAAESTDEIILPERILAAIVANRHQADIDLLLVECAGGIMVPLQRNYLQRDLLQAADIPILLTTRAGLGTINHTWLSIHALECRKICPMGLIVNRMPTAPGPVETDNLRYFHEALGVPVVAVVPDAPTAADAISAMRHNPRLQEWLHAYCNRSRGPF